MFITFLILWTMIYIPSTYATLDCHNYKTVGSCENNCGCFWRFDAGCFTISSFSEDQTILIWGFNFPVEKNPTILTHQEVWGFNPVNPNPECKNSDIKKLCDDHNECTTDEIVCSITCPMLSQIDHWFLYFISPIIPYLQDKFTTKFYWNYENISKKPCHTDEIWDCSCWYRPVSNGITCKDPCYTGNTTCLKGECKGEKIGECKSESDCPDLKTVDYNSYFDKYCVSKKCVYRHPSKTPGINNYNSMLYYFNDPYLKNLLPHNEESIYTRLCSLMIDRNDPFKTCIESIYVSPYQGLNDSCFFYFR